MSPVSVPRAACPPSSPHWAAGQLSVQVWRAKCHNEASASPTPPTPLNTAPSRLHDGCQSDTAGDSQSLPRAEGRLAPLRSAQGAAIVKLQSRGLSRPTASCRTVSITPACLPRRTLICLKPSSGVCPMPPSVLGIRTSLTFRNTLERRRASCGFYMSVISVLLGVCLFRHLI